MSKKYIYLILIALCFLVYYNSLHGEFVSDDIPGILQNPLIGKPFNYWAHPSDFLNSLNFLIAGHKPFVFHLTNVILHAIVTILVFYFLALFFNREASLLGASLYAVHPIHAEAVSWISGRTYLIVGLFMHLTYFLYLTATDTFKPGKKFRAFAYLSSLLIFIYYLYRNYAFYFLFPFLLVLADLVFKRWRKNWKWWLPFFAVVILRLILARATIAERVTLVAKDANSSGAIDWTNPFFNLAYSVFSHLGLLLWPAKLTLYHEPPVATLAMIRIGLIILGLLVCSLPLIFLRAKPIFFAICLFVLCLLPTYSPVLISWLVAERYLYFPSVSLSMCLAFFYTRYVGSGDERKKRGEGSKKQEVPQGCLSRRRNALMLFIFIIAAYGARTVARNEDWRTPARLWRSTVEVSSDSPRAHNNMGDVYGSEENVEGAIREFKRAIELKPDYADAYHNLANTYHQAGNLKEAISLYERAVYFNPRLVESRLNLGVIYINEGDFDLAIEHLKKAQELRPNDQAVAYALDFARQKRGK